MNRTEADAEFLIYCEKQRKLDPKTIRSYRHILEVFWKVMEDFSPVSATSRTSCTSQAPQDFRAAADSRIPPVSPGEVKREACHYYIRRLNEIYRPSSVHLHLNVIKTYFNYLEDMEYIPKTPFKNIRADIREAQHRPNVLNLDEIAAIMNAAAAGHPESDLEKMIYYRDNAILEMLFCTGMRVQELCDLTLDDVEMARGIIHVIGKRQKYRKCYITADQSRAALEAWLRERRIYLKAGGHRSRALFINRFCGPVSTNAVRNLITKYVNKSDINRRVTPHTFRHSFASILLEQGAQLSYIQNYLGHSTISTTQIYLHISDDQAREVLKNTHPRSRMKVLTPEKL